MILLTIKNQSSEAYKKSIEGKINILLSLMSLNPLLLWSCENKFLLLILYMFFKKFQPWKNALTQNENFQLKQI